MPIRTNVTWTDGVIFLGAQCMENANANASKPESNPRSLSEAIREVMFNVSCVKCGVIMGN
jgi:hypothetical protein